MSFTKYYISRHHKTNKQDRSFLSDNKIDWLPFSKKHSFCQMVEAIADLYIAQKINDQEYYYFKTRIL
ncbi:MAG: hypothetical protein EKK64_04010 [Neisseriaceae bacterium]|nr:MAG: hypothetical protein EKK64_04010 [Neisseriaceae bacterium]